MSTKTNVGVLGAAACATLVLALGGCRKTSSDEAAPASAAASGSASAGTTYAGVDGGVVTFDDAAVVLQIAGGGAAGSPSSATATGPAPSTGSPAATPPGAAPAPTTAPTTAPATANTPPNANANATGSPSGTSAAAGGASGPGAPNGSAAPEDPHPTEGGPPAGFVEFEKMESDGPPLDELFKVLKRNRDLYRSCYGKAVQGGHPPTGIVRLKVVVKADGAVERVDVIGGSLPPSPLIQCSVAKTRTIRFPAAAGTVKYDVSYATVP